MRTAEYIPAIAFFIYGLIRLLKPPTPEPAKPKCNHNLIPIDVERIGVIGQLCVKCDYHSAFNEWILNGDGIIWKPGIETRIYARDENNQDHIIIPSSYNENAEQDLFIAE